MTYFPEAVITQLRAEIAQMVETERFLRIELEKALTRIAELEKRITK